MFHGSYLKNDVTFLLKPVEIQETELYEKEKLIQSGKKHYSEMISSEYAPSPAYLEVFYKALDMNKRKMAENIFSLAALLSKKEKPILVSLARAGTPVGVLLKRTMRDIFKKNVPHYSISIIRDRGIDKNAIKHILNENNGNDKGIVFIDGWTGKGVISRELKKSIKEFNEDENTSISPDLYVLSDISGSAEFSVTYEDYMIPSSVLNSTISGLISRSILNDTLIGKDDFHGCKFYEELAPNDLSLWFADKIMEIIPELHIKNQIHINTDLSETSNLKKISEKFIKDAMEDYNVKNINYIKPGIGETTRVLLRRVPDRILLRNISSDETEHLLVLAKEKNVLIEEVKNMPYKATGIISNLER